MLNLLANLKHDLPAGLVVFLVALPLCLGVALASGAPLFSGIVAGIVGGTVVSLLSGSQLSVSGPAAGLTAITLSAIQDLGQFETFLLAGLIAGGIQLVLGYLGAGAISSFIPNAVIRGMLVAIGLILIIKQIPHAVGYGADLIVDETYAPESPVSLLREIEFALRSISLGATAVFIGAMFIVLTWDWFARRGFSLATIIPGPLLAVVWGLLFQDFATGTMLDIPDQHFVTLPEHESLRHLMGSLLHPDFSQWANPKVYQSGLTIAIVASIETLLSLEAVDRLDPLRRQAPANRELKAQGVGNMISALLGGLPITSVIVRSSANVNAGAKTKLASVTHGLLLLVSVLLFAELMNSIPLATLAAILLHTGFKLAKPGTFIDMYRRGKNQFIPFIITIIAILIDDLLNGIMIGTVIGLIFVIRSNFHSAIAVTRKGSNYLIRFRKDVTFLNKYKFRAILNSVEPNSCVLIDGSLARFMDRDILDCIIDFHEGISAKKLSVELRNVLGYSGELDDSFRKMTANKRED
jgi:MFS superfamily sulfate permease-like transporter